MVQVNYSFTDKDAPGVLQLMTYGMHGEVCIELSSKLLTMSL